MTEKSIIRKNWTVPSLFAYTFKNKIQGNSNSDSFSMSLKDRFADNKNDISENEKIKAQVILQIHLWLKRKTY